MYLAQSTNRGRTLSRLNWNLEVLVFEERGERSSRRKTSWSKDENQQQTQPTLIVMPSPGIEPGPHWLGTSALTTVPSLLP